MSHELDPKVGRWYRQVEDDELFKVVRIDEDDDLIEIRYADGDLEELDSVAWIELDLERAEEPEDWRDPDEGEEDEDDEDSEDEDEDDDDDDWDDDSDDDDHDR